jgi:CubicO group peptidase (beta-lactamase class C family)
LASDLLGRVVEAASGQRLADFLEQRLFAPLRMPDSGFWVEGKDLGRVAEPLPTDAAGNRTVRLIDVARKPANDSGGAGAVSTAADYLRFSQMLLSGGKLDGKRVMSRSSIALMTSDHLGDRIKTALTPGELKGKASLACQVRKANSHGADTPVPISGSIRRSVSSRST